MLQLVWINIQLIKVAEILVTRNTLVLTVAASDIKIIITPLLVPMTELLCWFDFRSSLTAGHIGVIAM